MADFSSANIPPPKDWQAFERKARVLFACELGDPLAQTNGTSGQRQNGVDIFGRRGGGAGPLVGVQCKGKDGNYGKKVSEKELRSELKKSEDFQPPLDEFILITTAADDVGIQESARLVEKEVRQQGRQIRVAVLGWGQLQSLISAHPQAIRAFSPDSTPFSDAIISEQNQIRELLNEQPQRLERTLETMQSVLLAAIEANRTHMVAPDNASIDPLDQAINEQIDTYRDLIRDGQPRTALGLLHKLKDARFASSTDKIKYRIIANIGAAHHALGEYGLAADLFLEAFPLNPDMPAAIANKIAAHIIKGDTVEAHTLAVAAMERFPDSPDIAFQRLHAHVDGEDLEALWTSFSAEAKKRVDSYIVRIGALREAGDARWHEVLAEAGAAFPEHKYLKAMRAEEILESHLTVDVSGLGATGGATLDDLTWAAEVFRDLWRESLRLEAKRDTAFAHNAALIFMFMGKDATAAELLDEAIEQGATDDELLRLRVSLHFKKGEQARARQLAGRLPSAPRVAVLSAELEIRNDPRKALELLEKRSEFSEINDIVAATTVAVSAFLALDESEAALEEVERLGNAIGRTTLYELERYRVLHALGSEGALAALDRAVQALEKGEGLPTRYLLGEALAEQARFDDVVDLLFGHVATGRDSPALRMLISAAANADRRATLSDLLGALPKDLLENPFYTRARAALALRMGDRKSAELEVRKYLAKRPKSLHMHLQLLQVLARLDKEEALKIEVAKPASEFEGAPEEFLHFAQFKDAYGDWREAHKLAYATWLSNQGSSAVNMRYMGVFLRPGHSEELDVSPAVVGSDMAVSIEIEGGPETFVIENEAALRPTAFYIPSDHAIAHELLGKQVGATIQLPDGRAGKINWIKPKQLHALHTILDTFNLTFPGVAGFARVSVDFKTEEGLRPIAEQLQERNRTIDGVFDQYSAGHLTLALAARLLGADPVETMLGLIEQGRQILSCEGTHAERARALSLLGDHQKKGCVVDAPTMHIIRRFGLEGPVAAACGPISIVEETAVLVQEKINRLLERPDKPDMTLIWKDGQIFRNEISAEQKADILRVVQEDKQWLDQVATVLPAQGTGDPSEEFRSIIRRFGSDFIDEVLAAQSSGKLLLSEDKLLRAIAKNEFGVEGVWLQAVLMRARDEGQLTQSEYAQAIYHLIESNLQYVSVDSGLLTWAMRNAAGLPLPDEFIRVSERLGGSAADLASHLGVAVQFVRTLWRDERKPLVLRSAAVGKLMECICRDRRLDEVHGIIATFLSVGRHDLNDLRLSRYVLEWRKGHFIPPPER